MNKETLDALLRDAREGLPLPHTGAPQPVLEPLAPVLLLPFWARMSLCFWMIWAWATEKREPGEPQKAIWVTLILFVVTLVLNEYLRPKPNLENARPAGLGDFEFPTATEGRVVPLIWGQVQMSGPNVVWYGDLFQEAIMEKVKTGLWSSTRITKGFRYHVGVQMALCRGPDVVLKKVWVGDVEVFSGTVTSGNRFDINLPELFGGDDLGSGGLKTTCDFYGGSTTQAVNAYLDDPSRQQVAQATQPDTAPRYTGTCHVVARELTSAAPLVTNRGAYLGNSTTIKPWKFELQRFPPIFSGQSAGQHIIGGADCNPMNVIFETLTNTEWGFGFPASDVDIGAGSSFHLASSALITEANGFSMILDAATTAVDFLNELQRQIDGVLYLDHQTGKWKVQLAREAAHAQFGYDPNTVPQFTDSNVTEVKEFTRGGWEDTTNQITVEFDKRDDNYKLSFALAQDMGNALIQGGGTVVTVKPVSGNLAFPGVKNSALANRIAWRELRGQSYPLARATFVVNREFWDLTIGKVFAWTNAKLGFTKLPMRVTRIDYGRLQDNKMTVQAVQDVFSFAAASYGDPPATGWSPPVVSLVAFPATQQLAMECPRGILVRDPNFGGDDTVSKVFAAARRQGSEVAFRIKQRNAVGAPGGAFANAGDVLSFMRIGDLTSALAAGTAIPTATVTITPTPDSQTALESVFNDGATLADLGVDLVQLILIDNEFMLVQSAANSGGNVNLQNVYRGALDSAQMAHAAGADVYLVFVGAGVTDTTFPGTNNVDIELRMRSSSEEFSGSVTTISMTMANRSVRPYLPASLSYQGSGTPFNTPALEGSGSGLDGFGFNVDWRRRRFTTGDEVAEMLADNTPISGTEYRVWVFVNPDTTNVQVYDSGWTTTKPLTTASSPLGPRRLEIVNEAAAGTEIRVRIKARHDFFATDIESRYTLDHDVNPTSNLTSQFYLGGKLRANVVSNAYTAAAAGTFTVNIGSLFNSQIQYRLNAGAFTNLTGYTPGVNTTGTIPGVAVNDTIEIRHQTNPASPALTFLELQNPSAVSVAYGVLSN